MPNRQLRIFRRSTSLIGVCEYCSAEFRSHLLNQELAGWELKVMFGRHKCNPGGADMSETKLSPHLIADGNVKRCSVCGYPFPADVKPSMSVAFSDHLLKAHKPGQPTEDMNQAAARIVREAIKD